MGFSEAQRKALETKLNGKHVRTRNAQGKELSYIEGWHAIAEANRVFGFNGWDRETIETTRIWHGSSGGFTQCAYTARVRISVRAGEDLVVREGHGAGHGRAPTPGEAHEQALKEAETDATKRALATFGNVFGLALYDKDQKGVRRNKDRRSKIKRRHKGDLVLALSPSDLELFERPEGFCSAVRKILELTKSAEGLMEFWRANQETVIGLRDQYPDLKNSKGTHFAQLLGELYTRRLQVFAERTRTNEARSTKPVATMNRLVTKGMPGSMKLRRLRDKDHLINVASQPCLVCGRKPVHAHHLRFAQPRAIGKKVSDEFTVPLCALHHRAVHDAGNEQDCWKRWKIDPLIVAQTLWYQFRTDEINATDSLNTNR